MFRKVYLTTAVLLVLVAFSAQRAAATETENLGIRALPAPGKVTVDGKTDDWDLTGGVFACNEVETQRETFSVWVHAMYDADRLYLLARWNDETPLNNPGSTKGDFGFAGDCLQFRIITGFDTKNERCSHWTCWRDRDQLDVMDVAYGRKFNEGGIKDAQTQGAEQEFAVNPDGKGYVQEIAIPWKLICSEGVAPKAGQSFVLTVEPNFTIGLSGRLSLKDIFRPGVKIDRVFTFMSNPCWGVAALEPHGGLTPSPVRLSDGREFPVHMDKGLPVIDWTGLIQQREMPGFETVSFDMPEDGYVSLIIRDAEGQVVRHLLSCAFFTRGRHGVKWDGLRTPAYRTPGAAVPAGQYTWEAIWHKGIGVRLRGFASNGGSAPWDNGPTTNWGGDHGIPADAATDGKKVYLGWTGAEAGKALVACNLAGDVQWKHTRGGIGGAHLVTACDGTVFVRNNKELYRLDAARGGYTEWTGRGSTSLALKSVFEDAPDRIDGLSSSPGRVYLSYAPKDTVAIIRASDGALERRIGVEAPGRMTFAGGRLYVVSGNKTVYSVNAEGADMKTVLQGQEGLAGIAIGPDGKVYLSVGAPDQQVKVFTPDGKPAGEIGRKGGRPALGPWVADGMLAPSGIAVDPKGQLWVAEAADNPKRISVWDTATGRLIKEFFGPTHYGASGGAILPADPNVMVGEGCEWRIDPATGRGACVGVFEQRNAAFARFITGSNGRTYLVTGAGMHTPPTYWVYERMAPGDYRLRAKIAADGKTKTDFWSDANGDGAEQPEEKTTLDGSLMASGYCSWSFWFSTDLSVYGDLTRGKTRSAVRVPSNGFTACGAPKWALDRVAPAPAAGFPSLDDQYLLEWTASLVRCWKRDGGALLWSYPNTFSGVHGSHYAPAPEMGVLRGTFGVVGTMKLPEPLGDVWALNGNCGEWYLFSRDGYFVTQLFQGDPMRRNWPEKAVPGAVLDSCPPGLGGEDFGGSLVRANDGRVYLQAGKTGLWNCEVVGLETVKPLGKGVIEVTEKETEQARQFHEEQLQASSGPRQFTIKRGEPQFTGSLAKDFAGAQRLQFEKKTGAGVAVCAAWDDRALYVGWEVRDDTPWVNGADAPEFMYARGDTVDLQLGTDDKLDRKRGEAGRGDMRLSIGNFRGKPVAVLYRKVSDVKAPRTFSSGVVKEYVMDYVQVLQNVTVKVNVDARGKRYTVEAAIPLSDLGLAITKGMAVRGDFGVTHGDSTGADTALRTYWSNQQTGLVNDEVFELKMEPRNWGTILFSE